MTNLFFHEIWFWMAYVNILNNNVVIFRNIDVKKANFDDHLTSASEVHIYL